MTHPVSLRQHLSLKLKLAGNKKSTQLKHIRELTNLIKIQLLFIILTYEVMKSCILIRLES